MIRFGRTSFELQGFDQSRDEQSFGVADFPGSNSYNRQSTETTTTTTNNDDDDGGVRFGRSGIRVESVGGVLRDPSHGWMIRPETTSHPGLNGGLVGLDHILELLKGSLCPGVGR